jgi:hypothetical protein
MVICSVRDEETLRLAAAKCQASGIRKCMFFEEDLDAQATAFATEPITGETRKFFKRFPLWTPEHAEAHE